jgi:hypothetical protein
MTARRKVLIAGGVAAIFLGPLAVASPAAADGCPYGTVPTRFSGVCTSGVAGGIQNSPPSVNAPDLPGPPPGSPFATVDGIPCTPEHLGACIGLSQSQPNH